MWWLVYYGSVRLDFDRHLPWGGLCVWFYSWRKKPEAFVVAPCYSAIWQNWRGRCVVQFEDERGYLRDYPDKATALAAIKLRDGG